MRDWRRRPNPGSALRMRATSMDAAYRQHAGASVVRFVASYLDKTLARREVEQPQRPGDGETASPGNRGAALIVH